jgi:hypothetical protein
MTSGDFEMAVSDVFVIAGHGTVVAGEAGHGPIRNGDIAQIWRHECLLGRGTAFVEVYVQPGIAALILANPDVDVEPGDLIRGTSGPQPA